jgi:DNA-binding winged helix-turn-helix (wHTH) protein/TolB-like protein/Flp pilus assembly protein TadD
MAISKQSKQLYQFGPFSIDAAERLLLKEGHPVPLTPKTFDLLLMLVENSGRLLGKAELMESLWPGSFVEEANLPNNISLLRRALGDDASEHKYIETVPKRGYRFVAEVVELSNAPTELIVEERTKATLTLEQESKAELQRTPDARTASASKSLRTWSLPVLAMVASAASISYFFLHKPEPKPSPIRSIAVLPFKPLVPDSRDQSLEIGMADTLIARLSSIKQIVVRPTSAVRKYIELDQDAVAAGREQGVDAVLDGSLQRSGERLRVRVRLVNVKDGQQVWADQFDEKVTDIFTVEDSISDRVAAVLAVTLTGEEREFLKKHTTENTEAYQLYAKGRLFYRQWTESSIQKALECFDRAIAIDPHYALAYAGKADVYSANGSMFMLPSEAMPKAREAAERALEIDERLAEAHYSMGLVKLYADWDLRGAEHEFKRGLELKPNDGDLLSHCGAILIIDNRVEEGLAEIERAQELDPVSVSVADATGKALYVTHHDDQALAHYREMVALYPNQFESHRGLGCVLRQKGLFDEAIAELQKAVALQRLDSCLCELGNAYALAGRRPEATQIVKELEKLSKQRYVSPVNIAKVYLGLGEKDLTFVWLEKGYQDHSDHMLRLGVDPSFDSVRSDRRFVNLLRRVGLQQ